MLTDPQYAVVRQLKIPVAVVTTFKKGELSSDIQIRYPVGYLRVRNSAEAACTTGSALQSLVSSSSGAKKLGGRSAPDCSEYSGRRVLHTR